MPRRIPLYARILLLFFLNLALLAAMFYALFRVQFRSGPDWLLPSPAGDRIDAVSDIIQAELNQEPPSEWSATLNRFENGYRKKVQFLAFDGQGGQMAGDAVTLPSEIRKRLAGPHRPPQRPGPDREPS